MCSSIAWKPACNPSRNCETIPPLTRFNGMTQLPIASGDPSKPSPEPAIAPATNPNTPEPRPEDAPGRGKPEPVREPVNPDPTAPDPVIAPVREPINPDPTVPDPNR